MEDQKSEELAVEIEFPENATDEELVVCVEKLALAANRYYRSLGGKGLKIHKLSIIHIEENRDE